MSSYSEVLNQVKSLKMFEQFRLLEELKSLVEDGVEVEGDDEERIPAWEVAESEAAYEDYLAGRDPGISLKELKLKLFGEKDG